MVKPLDLTGEKYGRLIVVKKEKIHITPKGRNVYMWLCKCDCGNTVVVSTSGLRSGGTRSCGCYRNQRIHETVFKDLTGRKYGRLTAKSHFIKNGDTYWHCSCDCGNKTDVLSQHLQRGLTKSCGCLRTKTSSKKAKTHGMSKTRIYKEWKGIKERCLNKNNSAYKNYGGRGITVCSEWIDDFMNFYNWAIENGYRDDLTIERKDVNGNYCPENCCWIPLKEQALNTRLNVFYEYKGQVKTMSQWARYAGIKYQTFVRRLKVSGWTIEKAIETPVIKY